MKRLALVASFVLGTCASLSAQQPSLLLSALAAQPAAPASTFNFTLVPELAPPATPSESFAFPSPKAALPDAPAPPQSPSFNDEGYRWDLAVGYEYIHFDSAQFSANLSGLHTDLTYKLNPWFGLEGNVVSAGGGADWAYNSRVSLRAEGDYVRSTLYSSTQNNFQIGLGAVIHF